MSDYQTPRKEDESEKSLDEEDDLNDRENAEEFYTLKFWREFDLLRKDETSLL